MGTEPETLSLADAVRRAVDACDSGDPELAGLLERFEDADEPITAIEDIELRLADAGVDVDPASPALAVAAATVVYLAHRRDMQDAGDEDLLRTAVRSEWSGNPPEHVAAWLADRGVEV